MRPIRLSLQAFGSYAGALTIDFSRLGRHGIFAITGPTGAGKSTIFDAMVYALYDDLPGFRENGNIRSHYVDEATLTQVCLDFEVHGEEWHIERCPTQLVPRARGKGDLIRKDSTVLLRQVGSNSGGLTRKAEVAKKIEELVGLTKEQFEQVVLIPQGRFEEVLKADTARRASLLKRLFPVEIFTRVTEVFHDISSKRANTFEEATRRRTELEDQIRGSLGAIIGQLPSEIASSVDAKVLTEEEFNVEKLDDYLAVVVDAHEELKHLAEEAKEDANTARTRYDKAVQEAKAWDEWQENLAKAAKFPEEEEADVKESELLDRARKLQALGSIFEQWEEEDKRLRELEVNRNRIMESLGPIWIADYDRALLDEISTAQELARQIDDDVTYLKRAADRFDELSKQEAQLKKDCSDLEDRKKAHDEMRKEIEVRERQLLTARDHLKGLKEKAAALDVVVQEVRRLEGELEQARGRAKAESELTYVTRKLKNAEENARLANQHAADMREAWKDGLAGRLAQMLTDGEPCPTCGALDHPAPAILHPDAPGDKELEQAEQEVRRAEEEVKNLSSKKAAAEGAIEALANARDIVVVEAELDEKRSELADLQNSKEEANTLEVSLEEETNKVQADRESFDRESRELDIDTAMLTEREKRFVSERQSFIDEHGSFASTRSAAQSREELANQVKQFAKIKIELDRTQELYQKSVESLQPTMDAFGVDSPAALLSWRISDEELAKRDQRLSERRDYRRDVRARIDEYEKSGAPHIRPDPAPLKDESTRAASIRDDLIGRLAVVEQQVQNLKEMPTRLEEAHQRINAARTSYEQAKTVADVCAGKGAGLVGTRLSLENWVLADYLRQVLRQANVRLSAMTNGRYSLQLSEGVTDGRKQWGLELDTFDVNTGQTRPVNTLSGGETFMAALALALGLADVVSGGSNREVGALFIDEGFGSLDPQSLDAVIEVLRSLEDGGRIVGVISHVEEMNQALPNGITVSTSNSGSKAEVHYPPK